MMNRKQLDNGNIQFEDFVASAGCPVVGMAYEVPMNAFGSVVARYEVISVAQAGNKVVAEARRVS